MILDIVTKSGELIAKALIRENNEDGELQLVESTKGITDHWYDRDDYFDTNDERLILEINQKRKDHFLTVNYETIRGKTPKECIPLIKELNSYCALLRHYYNNNYRDVWVLIQNYFGHIDYGKEFGYFKTHDEICDILLYNFFISHEKEFETHFEDFCKRQIGKIRWNLENEHNYIVDESYIEKRIYGCD